ncbi:Mbeg1-like protein [uncultured Parolsenella sp.]|uniref:Mbeg1-like protein n=1 Tax=uncultured Parolsenella sp. TaxID=2083008 RepID=UPI0027D9BFCE|nr:Mbeg1-like protein [uncultured Parolsenella sp.]
MATMLDYLDWRSDLTFAQDPFNEVDSLILTQVSYLALDGVVPSEEEGGFVTVREAARRYEERVAAGLLQEGPTLVPPATPEPFYKMASSRRFGAARLSRFANVLDDEATEQFSALCVGLDDGSTYVVFRGTDDSFCGWREDFRMTYTVVGSQRHAVAYLEDVRRHTRGPLRVGGHSKGGNLAMYATAMAGWLTRRRVREVWVHDGPGFMRGLVPAEALEAIEGRVRRFVPEFCVVGQLLGQSQKREVVASATTAVMQHSPVNWQVEGNHFVRRSSIDERAQRIGEVFGHVIDGQDSAFLRRLTDGLFEALAQGGASLSDVAAGAPGSYLRIARAYSTLDPDVREAVSQMVGALVGESLSKGLADAGAAVGEALESIVHPK